MEIHTIRKIMRFLPKDKYPEKSAEYSYDNIAKYINSFKKYLDVYEFALDTCPKQMLPLEDVKKTFSSKEEFFTINGIDCRKKKNPLAIIFTQNYKDKENSIEFIFEYSHEGMQLRRVTCENYVLSANKDDVGQLYISTQIKTFTSPISFNDKPAYLKYSGGKLKHLSFNIETAQVNTNQIKTAELDYEGNLLSVYFYNEGFLFPREIRFYKGTHEVHQVIFMENSGKSLTFTSDSHRSNKSLSDTFSERMGFKYKYYTLTEFITQRPYYYLFFQ